MKSPKDLITLKPQFPPEWASPSLGGAQLWAKWLPYTKQLGQTFLLLPGHLLSWAVQQDLLEEEPRYFMLLVLSHMHEVQEREL